MGFFITLEGGEGTGKSTQAKRLSDYLRKAGHDVVQTREPGGTPEAEVLRDLLVHGQPGRWSVEAEALLNYAARDHHLNHLIRPALSRGSWVVCDRFMDSTRAYQCYAGGCPDELVDALEKAIVKDTRPNLTLIFDLEPSAGLARANGRTSGGGDRYERKGLPFHEKLREGFAMIAAREPSRCKVIDAAQDADSVFATVLKHVEAFSRG
jgi:dTMP kinase